MKKVKKKLWIIGLIAKIVLVTSTAKHPEMKIYVSKAMVVSGNKAPISIL